MTEKRSDYQRKIKHKKNNGLINSIKAAFESDDNDGVDVNPDFTRDQSENNSSVQSPREEQRREHVRGFKLRKAKEQADRGAKTEQQLSSEQKGLRLKRKLNTAIIILIILIGLVLFALFHL